MPENKLISHIKDERGAIHATLVALSPDQIGVAIRNPKDSCNKRLAVTVAEGRARKGTLLSRYPNRFIVRDREEFLSIEYLPELIDEEFYALRLRAENYFKPQPKQLGS